MSRWVAAVALAGAVLVSGSVFDSAEATFIGAYEVSNWSSFDNAGGSVNTAGAPDAISLISGNTGVGGETSFTVTAVNDGWVTFDYSFSTVDWSPFWDPFGYVLNGVNVELVNDNADPLVATISFFVNKGDVFGFFANTVDGVWGASTTVVSNFKGPQAVPEPAMLAIFGTALFSLGVFQRRRARVH